VILLREHEASERIAAALPEQFTPLHWHGETFDLPARAVRFAETAVVPNQAFQIGSSVIGLQFHLEATTASVQSWSHTRLTRSSSVNGFSNRLRGSSKRQRYGHLKYIPSCIPCFIF
jgi:GMP synthase-like glutamine amidotransferase